MFGNDQDIINEMNSVEICKLRKEVDRLHLMVRSILVGMLLGTGVLIASMFMGCSNIIYDPPNPPDLLPDCESACAKLAELGCQGWQGSPGEDEIYGTTDDVGCVEACGVAAINQEINLQLSCVAQATTCEAYEACY